MAVDAVPKVQGYNSPLKPSVLADMLPAFIGDVRRKYDANGAAAAAVIAVVAPWAGVIESVASVALISGGVGTQNSIAMTVGGTNAFAAAADGNTFLDNATIGTEANTYPTAPALLVTQDDGVDRVEFDKGDVILITNAGANIGTVRAELVIAKKVPHRV